MDDQDRLTSYGGASYQYTNNGELSRKIVGSDTTFYTYDALGNLTEVVLPDGTEIGYLIDAQNRRIGKTVNDTLVRAWLYQGQLTPVAELDGAGAVVSRFVYATGVNVPDYLIRGDSTYRLVRDHLGSVRLVVNVASGTVAQRVAYDEFGGETANTSPGWQPFGYAGGLTDAATGLVRFGARDYDPEAGRWTAKDPIGFAGGATSLYNYAANDPANSVDPEGLIVRAPIDFGPNVMMAAKWALVLEMWPEFECLWDETLRDLNSLMFVAFGLQSLATAPARAASGGPLVRASYAQRRFQETFQPGGRFAGQTIDDVAGALRRGKLSPSDVPVEYIVRDGNTLILNTRSSMALNRAGIPRSAWTTVDATSDAAAQARLSGQLRRNRLSTHGF